MKILHIAPIGVRAEGIGTVLSKLIPEQIKSGHDIRIASVRNNSVYNELDVVLIDTLEKLKTEIQSNRPDLVQFHSLYRQEYIGYSKYLRHESIPYIVQMHGALSDMNYQKNKWKKWIANTLFFKEFVKKSNGMVFLSEEERARCVANNWNERSYIIPNGCDSPSNILLKKNPSKPIDILYLGRISKTVKGLDYLVDAIKLLKQRNIAGLHISFYGNPSDADVEWLKNELQDLSDLASYNGGIYGKDKDKRMRQSDIFILTSPSEGMPMGVLESFAYGIPSIVTPGTNMANVIRRNNAGWTCELKSDSIADTIEFACKDYSNHCLLYHENALGVSSFYKWDNIARLSIQIYKEIIDEINANDRLCRN